MTIAIPSSYQQIVRDQTIQLPQKFLQILKEQWIKIGLVALAAISCLVVYLHVRQHNYFKTKLLTKQQLIEPNVDVEQPLKSVKILKQQFESIVIPKQEIKIPLIPKQSPIPVKSLKQQFETDAIIEPEVKIPEPSSETMRTLEQPFEASKISEQKKNSKPIPKLILTSSEIQKNNVESAQSILRQQNENANNQVILTPTIRSGKTRALEEYKRNPQQCKRMSRTLSLRDIKSIESPFKHHQDVTSVVGLMHYFSDLTEIDLRHEKCMQIAVDVLKECDKNTNGQLIEWLIKQETFNEQLLAKCLSVFIEKEKEQVPIDLYALEQLLRTYQNKSWNQASNHIHSPLISNDPLMISAMAILIKQNPNENRVIALAEWFMKQPEYDSATFHAWLQIFKQKQSDHSTAAGLYYPLLNRMFAHFKEKWGKEPPLDLVKVQTKVNPEPAHLSIKPPLTKVESKQNILRMVRNQNTATLTIPPGKARALEEYKKNPQRCKRMSRTLSLRDIKHIESPLKNNQDVTSVVGLMHYFSDLSEIDLRHEKCMQIAVDVLKECDKNTNGQLIEWLIKQETFNEQLLAKCLSAFIEKEEKQAPIDLYALEQLIRTYQNKSWNHTSDLQVKSNDPSLVSAMAILIKQNPNENRVIALAEWFMNQPEYDSATFSTWLHIFREKERHHSTAAGLHYPLLNKMLVHFKEKWGTAESSLNLDPTIALYLQHKSSLSRTIT